MKTRKTIEIEKALYEYSGAHKVGTYGCFECTLGNGYGNERIDFITMDTGGQFKCYEIKVSKADFLSKAKLSFCGDYNYLVIPEELYEEIKDSERFTHYLWLGIGIIFYSSKNGKGQGSLSSVRNAKKRQVPIYKKVELMAGMVRSLSRFCYITPENEGKTLNITEDKAGKK